MRKLVAVAAFVAALGVPAAAAAVPVPPPVAHHCTYTWPGATRCHTVG